MLNTDLWPFAVEFYQRPGVADTCLALQAQGGNVCLVLAACWLGQRGVRLEACRIAALQKVAEPWHAQVITPLREVRMAWREPCQADQAWAELREQVKALELNAERHLLDRLQALGADWPTGETIELAAWLEAAMPHPQRDEAAVRVLLKALRP